MANFFKLKKLISGYKSTPALFSIPNSDLNECGVRIYTKYFRTNNKFLFTPKHNHICAYDEGAFEINNDKVIVIGHPNKPYYNGLSYSSLDSMPSSYIKKKSGEKYTIMFGLMCFGYELFSKHDWNNLSVVKITFLGEVATEIGSRLPKLHSYFAKIYSKTYKIIASHNENQNTFEMIKSNYEKHLLEIGKNISSKDGRAIAILYLSNKIEYLTKL